MTTESASQLNAGREVASPQRLSVAISLLSHAPEMTGSATYARELIRALGARADEVSLEVLCNEHAFARLDGDVGEGVMLRRARGFRVGKSSASRAVALFGAAIFPARLTRQLANNPAVVHYPLTVGLPRVALPTVLTLHDTQHLDLPQQWTRVGSATRAWRSLTYFRAARAATIVVADSEYARRRIIDHLGIAPD